MDQIPRGLELTEFRQKYSELTHTKFAKSSEGVWSCRTCGTVAGIGTAWVSIHNTEFSGCAGGGDVRKIPYFGCVQCEPEGYSMSACVHLALGEDVRGDSLLPEEFRHLLR